jgi:hypothetical protein
MTQLQTFAEFEESLNLRSQTISGRQFIYILDLLSDRFNLEKQDDSYGSFVYRGENFGLFDEWNYSFSCVIDDAVVESVTYKTKTDILKYIKGCVDEGTNIHDLFLTIEKVMIDFLGFPKFQVFDLERPIKKVSLELQLALGIKTKYEFHDVILAKQTALNNAIAGL